MPADQRDVLYKIIRRKHTSAYPDEKYRLERKLSCSLQDPLFLRDTRKPRQISYLREKLGCSLQDEPGVYDGLVSLGIAGSARHIPGVVIDTGVGSRNGVLAIFAGCPDRFDGIRNRFPAYGDGSHVCVSAGTFSDCKHAAGVDRGRE